MDNSESLKHQVLINHFTNATGCSVEQAVQLLEASSWHFEMALSMFFQESAVAPHPTKTGFNPLCAPSNTPATPPSFSDALLALHRLQASENNNNSCNFTSTTVNSGQQKVPLQHVNPCDSSRGLTTSVIRASPPKPTLDEQQTMLWAANNSSTATCFAQHN